jgi:hypothetical protein
MRMSMSAALAGGLRRPPDLLRSAGGGVLAFIDVAWTTPPMLCWTSLLCRCTA